MGREADADEPLLCRARRVFATEERSFRMDRRSPAAAGLRTVIADVLPRFLASYSDDTLAMKQIWEELGPKINALLELGKTRVVSSILATCQRLETDRL